MDESLKLNTKIALPDIINLSPNQATLIAAIPLFLCGVEASFAADWKNLFPNKTVTLIEESLIGSINLYGRVLGSIGAGHIVNTLGRKSSILISLVFYTISWIIISYFSYNIQILYIGRIFSGVACGMRAGIVLYVSELAHKNRRGKLLTFCQMSTSAGITITYLIQYFLSPMMVSIFALIISVFGLTQAFFLYETKYWLLMKNRPEEAQLSMLWFNDTMTVKDALEEIEEIQTQQNKSTKRSQCCAVCNSWSNVKQLIVCVLIFVCRPTSGRIPILVHPHNYYKLFILPVSIEIVTLIQGILEFLFSLSSFFVADSFSRKSMLQWVCWTMLSCLTVSYYQVALVDMLGVFGEWINLISLMIYIGLACGPLMSFTLVTVTEIASTATDVRGVIQTTCQFFNNLMNAILTSFFPLTLVSMPVNYVLLFISANLVVLSLLVTIVPETVGLALHKCEWKVVIDQEEELLSETENQDIYEDDTEKLIYP